MFLYLQHLKKKINSTVRLVGYINIKQFTDIYTVHICNNTTGIYTDNTCNIVTVLALW